MAFGGRKCRHNQAAGVVTLLSERGHAKVLATIAANPAAAIERRFARAAVVNAIEAAAT
jgi:hypothetical protein